MQVKLRLQRFGNKKRPYYRIVAATITKKRDGKFLDIIGLYHPLSSPDNQIRLFEDKVIDWLNKGAEPTNTVKSILQKQGIWSKFKSAAASKAETDQKKEEPAATESTAG